MGYNTPTTLIGGGGMTRLSDQQSRPRVYREHTSQRPISALAKHIADFRASLGQSLSSQGSIYFPPEL